MGGGAWYSAGSRVAVLGFAIGYAAISLAVDLWHWWRWDGFSGWFWGK